MGKTDLVIEHLNDATMITRLQGEYLVEVLSLLPEEGRMLELGTGHGDSTILFSKLKPKWTIYTIDGYGLYGDIKNIFKPEGEGMNSFHGDGLNMTLNHINSQKCENIIVIVGNTATVPWELPINFLFIDSDHSYKWVKTDTERYSPFIIKGGVIAYDDCNTNWGVEDYFREKMETNPDWKTWRKDSLGFAERMK